MINQSRVGKAGPRSSFNRSVGTWRVSGNALNNRLMALTDPAIKKKLLAEHFEELDLRSVNELAFCSLNKMTYGRNPQLMELTETDLPDIMNEVCSPVASDPAKSLPFVFAAGRIFAGAEGTSFEQAMNYAFHLNGLDHRIFPGIMQFACVADPETAGDKSVRIGVGLPRLFDDGLDDSFMLYIFREIITADILCHMCATSYRMSPREEYGRADAGWASFYYCRDFEKLPNYGRRPMLSIVSMDTSPD